jgi:peptide/nickel transport system substrate-binding protein
MLRTLLPLVLLLSLGLLLGCGPDKGTSNGGTTKNGNGGNAKNGENGEKGNGASGDGKAVLTRSGRPPATDDVLLMYYGDDPDTLNLITSNDNVSSTFQRPVYEYLAMRRYDDPKEWENQLAEKWDFDKEKLEFTIHLRKGVKWHPMKLPNGTDLPRKEVTARDVLFTFDCILNEHVEAASLRSYYTDADATDPAQKVKIKVTKVDDYTVKIKWNKPYFMAHDFTLAAQIMPRHVYSVDAEGEPISLDFSSKEFADGFNNHWANTTMCGTGPLIFKEWKKGDQVTLERNPDYWGQPYYFSKVVYQFISNPNTATQKVLQNELDFAGIPQIDQYMQSKEHANVKSGKVKLIEYQRTAYRYMGYNLQRDLFKDKKLRTALSYAVPVDDIVKEIYFGLASRTTGPFVPGGQFYDSSIVPIPLDLDKSKQLLEEAGWKDTNENGVRDKTIDGKLVELRFDLMIFSDSPMYLSIGETIKSSMRQVGVDVLLSPTKWALMLQKLRKKEFDATILGWVADWKSDPYQIWHGSQADLPDSSNYGYQNPEVDKAIDELRVTMDEEEQVKLYYKIHRLIHEDQPYTFLYAEKATAGMDARIENVNFYPLMRPHLDLREWYSSTPRLLGN